MIATKRFTLTIFAVLLFLKQTHCRVQKLKHSQVKANTQPSTFEKFDISKIKLNFKA
jgi:hypothetical protein